MNRMDVDYSVRIVNLAQACRRAEERAERRRERRQRQRKDMDERIFASGSLMLAGVGVAIELVGLWCAIIGDWRSAAVLAYSAAACVAVSALLWR